MVYKKQFSRPTEGIQHVEFNLPILKEYKSSFIYVKADSPPNEVYSNTYPKTLKDWRETPDPCVYYYHFYRLNPKDSSRISIKKLKEMYEFEIELNSSSEDYEEIQTCLLDNGWTKYSSFHVPRNVILSSE